MALLRYVSIFAAAYFLMALISTVIFGEPRWGGCFILLLFAEFSRLFTVWFNFALRGK
ncbi:hypothetical protein CUJ84_Chr000859 [Rhizobium leguminosarum]|uniref:Uncharacterized protein n=1 Tax=Rhizobium leguminosarum TaxID=384 RepID=A0A2K9YZ73_RHILE|nr:hypothetical protein CUJ84_Chr000859 [Rhizobium leguminosarum]